MLEILSLGLLPREQAQQGSSGCTYRPDSCRDKKPPQGCERSSYRAIQTHVNTRCAAHIPEPAF